MPFGWVRVGTSPASVEELATSHIINVDRTLRFATFANQLAICKLQSNFIDLKFLELLYYLSLKETRQQMLARYRQRLHLFTMQEGEQTESYWTQF